MMYADLVDMDDFMAVIAKLGIPNEKERDFEQVTCRIKQWLSSANEQDSHIFWATMEQIEEEGILLPDVENIILWSRDYQMAM
ncbi:hypothetical protein KW523_20755 [Vibrio fluvialis]|nr:hypothetical protein [Vibrio fluvialis]MBY8225163.1 hypothetical protein [Vibrio fluvialis]